MKLSSLCLILCAVFLFPVCNSGPPQGEINGEPVDGNALIRMEPLDSAGQPAEYELTISPGQKKVQLYWMQGGPAVADTASQGTGPKPVQRFPKKYNDETELRYTVEAGKHVKDFAITVP